MSGTQTLAGRGWHDLQGQFNYRPLGAGYGGQACAPTCRQHGAVRLSFEGQARRSARHRQNEPRQQLFQTPTWASRRRATACVHRLVQEANPAGRTISRLDLLPVHEGNHLKLKLWAFDRGIGGVRFARSGRLNMMRILGGSAIQRLGRAIRPNGRRYQSGVWGTVRLRSCRDGTGTKYELQGPRPPAEGPDPWRPQEDAARTASDLLALRRGGATRTLSWPGAGIRAI